MTLTEAESARTILTSFRINCEIGESFDEGDYYVHVNDKMANGTEIRLMIYEWSVIYQSIAKARAVEDFAVNTKEPQTHGHQTDHFSHIPFSRLNPSTN